MLEDLEREREFYRRQCNELGTRLLRLQEEQARAQQEARFSRITAMLIREVYRLVDNQGSLDEIRQRFLEVIQNTLNVDRAALLRYYPEDRSFLTVQSLGFPPAASPDFKPPVLPEEYLFVNSATPAGPLVDCLRQAAGVPYLLWAFDPQVETALLLGNVIEDQHLHRPFEAGDREVIEGSLQVFIDISARKRAEEALRESEERFRQVISSISDHIYMTEFTGDGRPINRYLSPHIEALTGYPLERFLSDWSFWPSLIHPEDRAAAAAQVERFIRRENSEVEYRLMRADGEAIWVRDSGRVEPAPGGQGFVVYGVVSQVTGRRQTEEALAKRVNELNCLNEIGRAIAETPAIPELLEWVTERIPPAMRYPELCIAAIEYDDQLYGVAGAVNQPCQMTQALRIGGVVMGRVYIAYIEKRDFLDEESALVGGIATRLSGYIESRRLVVQLEARATELQEAENFLNSIIDNLPLGLFVKEADRLQYVRWNKSNVLLTGLPEQEVLGKTDFDFFPEDMAAFFTAKDREVLNGGVSLDIPEAVIETASKEKRIQHTRKVPILGLDGQPRYLLGMSEDITERKQAEDALRRSRAQLSEALAIARLGYWEFEFETGLFTFNDQFYALFGTTAEQEGGYQMTVADYTRKFLHPADAAVVGAETRRAFETTDPDFSVQVEARHFRVDGEEIYLNVRFRVQKDEQGRTIRLYGANQDVTARKRAELERERLLAEVEEAYREYVRQEWADYLGEQAPDQRHTEYHPAEPGNGTGTTQVMPMTLRGQPIGTISLRDAAPDRHWTDDELILVETVAEQLALTLENLRLFSDTQRRATREQLTRQITDKMRAASDVDSIIGTGLTELARVLGVSRAYVRLNPQPAQAQTEETAPPDIEAIRGQLKRNGHHEITDGQDVTG